MRIQLLIPTISIGKDVYGMLQKDIAIHSVESFERYYIYVPLSLDGHSNSLKSGIVNYYLRKFVNDSFIASATNRSANFRETFIPATGQGQGFQTHHPS